VTTARRTPRPIEVGGEGFGGLAGAQRGEVLGADLHQIGGGDQRIEPVAPDVHVGLDGGAHVGVERDEAVRLGAGERGEGIGDRRDGDGIGAEVQARDLVAEGGQVGGGDARVGRAGAVELVGGHARGVEADEADRGGAGGGDGVGGRDALVGEDAREARAEHVGGEPGQEARAHAEPREAERHVEGRAAGAGREGAAAGPSSPSRKKSNRASPQTRNIGRSPAPQGRAN
jgi:hypothetical protein